MTHAINYDMWPTIYKTRWVYLLCYPFLEGMCLISIPLLVTLIIFGFRWVLLTKGATTIHANTRDTLGHETSPLLHLKPLFKAWWAKIKIHERVHWGVWTVVIITSLIPWNGAAHEVFFWMTFQSLQLTLVLPCTMIVNIIVLVCEGISGKSQILFAIVFTTRYLDLLTSFISLYNTCMKVRRTNGPLLFANNGRQVQSDWVLLIWTENNDKLFCFLVSSNLG